MTGTAGQPVGLPYGRAALNRHRQGKVGHHAAKDDQLLPVLLPQQEAIGLYQGQQPADHRRHSLEMPRPTWAAEALEEVGRWAHVGDRPIAARKKFLRGRGEKSIGTGGLRQGRIGSQVAGIAIEILARTKLQQIDEDAEQNPGSAGRHELSSPEQELAVTRVQAAHGGHEMERPVGRITPPCG